MSPTSQSTGRKFPFSSKQNLQLNNWTIYVALAVSAGLGFLFTLLLYALRGLNPLNRLGYGLFVSLLPAIGAWVFLKLTKLLVSWRGAVLIYLLLFLLIFIQTLGRLIPVL